MKSPNVPHDDYREGWIVGYQLIHGVNVGLNLRNTPPGTHKQTYQERIGRLTAEIRQKISCALSALLMRAVTGITCFPHTPITYQNVLKSLGQICAKTHVGLVGYTETSAERFSVMFSVLTLSAYAYQEALPLVLAMSVCLERRRDRPRTGAPVAFCLALSTAFEPQAGKSPAETGRRYASLPQRLNALCDRFGRGGSLILTIRPFDYHRPV